MEQSKIIDTLETYQSPAWITSPSPSPCRHADKTLPRHFTRSRVRGTSSRWTCEELGRDVRSMLDRSKGEEVRLHEPRCQTLPLSVYEGTWTHSPPLISMHLLDRSCVSVGFFLKLHATFPNSHLLYMTVVVETCHMEILDVTNSYIFFSFQTWQILVHFVMLLWQALGIFTTSATSSMAYLNMHENAFCKKKHAWERIH